MKKGGITMTLKFWRLLLIYTLAAIIALTGYTFAAHRQLDRLLAAMRRAGVSVPYKAVLTEHNKNWTFADLVTEVAREHEAMRAARKADTVQ